MRNVAALGRLALDTGPWRVSGSRAGSYFTRQHQCTIRASGQQGQKMTKSGEGDFPRLLEFGKRFCGMAVDGMGRGADAAGYAPASRQQRLMSTAVTSMDVLLEGETVPAGLRHVLRCEVDDLLKRSQDITPRKPPRPFILVKDEPGEQRMTLSRIYGLEDISVSCVLQLVPKKLQPEPEVGVDPDARNKMLQLTVCITKGAPYPILDIKCECYRFGFAIHQVDLIFEDKEESVYRPYFSESKRSLANEFQIFLYQRGLNADFCRYIEMHLDKKRMLKSAKVIGKIEMFLA